MNYRIIPVTGFQQNCSLIWCNETRHGAFVDPGGEADRLLMAAESEGITIDRVLLTHGHLDHVGAAREIGDRLAIPVEGPQREDAFWLAALPQQAETFGLPHMDPFEPDRWLEDGDTVSVGNLSLEVLLCPGHTPGHVVFHQPEARLAFVGDVLFRGSIGRTDFPRGDHDALLTCIHDRLLPLGDDTRFVPGHGPISTFGKERRNNPFLHRPA